MDITMCEKNNSRSEIPWTARRSNHSILKEISPGCSLEGMMLKVKEESENVGLQLNIPKMKIMASGPITSWEIDGETMSDFILGGLQNHCRW